MQCFICVTYLMIICSAYPPKTPELSKTHDKRSLFRDVIESLRIRVHLPEDLNPIDENNISQNDERYGLENEPLQLPGDADFMPRRNDRLEMPSLKYRYPKSFIANDNITAELPKEEIVLYVETPSDTLTKTSTAKPKKQKRPRPPVNNKPNKNKEKDNTEDSETMTDNNNPFNTLAGQSQIGNRESQTVVKPTVIVNFRGTVTHRESEIRLERTNNNDTKIPQTIFNIKQEVKLDRANTGIETAKKTSANIKQDVQVLTKNENPKTEEKMIMCESNSFEKKTNRSSRKDNVLQILFTI